MGGGVGSGVGEASRTIEAYSSGLPCCQANVGVNRTIVILVSFNKMYICCLKVF